MWVTWEVCLGHPVILSAHKDFTQIKSGTHEISCLLIFTLLGYLWTLNHSISISYSSSFQFVHIPTLLILRLINHLFFLLFAVFAWKLFHQFYHVHTQIPISGLQKLVISTNRSTFLQSDVFLQHEVIYVYWFKNHTPDFNFPLLILLINQVNTLGWARQCPEHNVQGWGNVEGWPHATAFHGKVWVGRFNNFLKI